MLKVCGLKFQDNIKAIAALAPDFMGFIFYPKSPRYVVGNLDPEVLKHIPPGIKKVGVFVNEDIEKILDLVNLYNLDMLQLHGNESPEYCRKCRKHLPVIKAFAVTDDFDFGMVEEYRGNVDYYLFDTKTEKYGGSGRKFNWALLKNISIDAPWFLSGGIGAEDIENVARAGLPSNVILDVNSKIEIEPGLKDLAKISAIKEKLKKNILTK